MKQCLSEDDFRRSNIFIEMREAAHALGYETVGDMNYSEFQIAGSARSVARQLGFSKNAIIKYLRSIGVNLKYKPLNRITRRHIVSLYRRGFSGKYCARLFDRGPTTIRRALLRDLGPVEYRNLTDYHRRNKRG